MPVDCLKRRVKVRRLMLTTSQSSSSVQRLASPGAAFQPAELSGDPLLQMEKASEYTEPVPRPDEVGSPFALLSDWQYCSRTTP